MKGQNSGLLSFWRKAASSSHRGRATCSGGTLRTTLWCQRNLPSGCCGRWKKLSPLRKWLCKQSPVYRVWTNNLQELPWNEHPHCQGTICRLPIPCKIIFWGFIIFIRGECRIEAIVRHRKFYCSKNRFVQWRRKRCTTFLWLRPYAKSTWRNCQLRQQIQPVLQGGSIRRWYGGSI